MTQGLTMKCLLSISIKRSEGGPKGRPRNFFVMFDFACKVSFSSATEKNNEKLDSSTLRASVVIQLNNARFARVFCSETSEY